MPRYSETNGRNEVDSRTATRENYATVVPIGPAIVFLVVAVLLSAAWQPPHHRDLSPASHTLMANASSNTSTDALFALNQSLTPWVCGPLASSPICRSLAESLPPAVAIAAGDIDGDGKDDIAAVGEGPVTLCLSGSNNKPHCGFVDAGSEPSSAISLGDANGDGRTDFALSRLNGHDKLCLGQGGWNFLCQIISLGGDTMSTMPSYDLVMADIDADNRDEIIIAQTPYEGIKSGICEIEGEALECHQLRDTSAAGSRAVSVGDVDGNGTLDIALGGGSSGTHDLCIGDGSGEFLCSPAAGIPRGGVGPALGDLNGDGSQELLFVGSNAIACRILIPAPIQFHCFTFLEGYGGLAAAVGDLNGDGHADIVTAGPERLCQGTGLGSFECNEIDLGESARGRSVVLANLAAWLSDVPDVDPTPYWTATSQPSVTPSATPSTSPTTTSTPSSTVTATDGPSPTATATSTATPLPDRGVDLQLHFASRLDFNLALTRLAATGSQSIALMSECQTLNNPDRVSCQNSLLELDLSDPAAPQDPHQHPIGRSNEQGMEIAIAGEFIYVAFEQHGPNGRTGIRLSLYQKSSDGAFSETASRELTGNLEQLALATHGARVAWSHRAPDLPDQGAVLLLEPDSSTSPTQLVENSRIPLPAYGLDFGETATGTRLYLAPSRAPQPGARGMWTYDITNTADPHPLSLINGDFTNVLSSGHQVILERFGIRTCRDPLDPQVAFPCGYSIEDTDLTDPQQPHTAWTWQDLRLNAAALAAEDAAIVASNTYLYAFSRSDTAWPLRQQQALLTHDPDDETQPAVQDLAFLPRPNSDANTLGHAYILLRKDTSDGPHSQIQVVTVTQGRRVFLPLSTR